MKISKEKPFFLRKIDIPILSLDEKVANFHFCFPSFNFHESKIFHAVVSVK